MNIDDITLGQAKELVALLGKQGVAKTTPFKIGVAYFIRTVTMNWHGVVKEIHDQALVLEKGAAWIADSGRFADAIKDPNLFKEVEPIDHAETIIGLGGLIDAVPVEMIEHSQK